MPPTSIGIIGTAGRGNDGAKMSKQLFGTMLAKAEQIITEQLKLKWKDIMLVSGGAAWSDHVAVKLHNIHGCGLTLFLPCGWDDKTQRFIDTDNPDWRKNPGKSANRYHTSFSNVIGKSSLNDIQLAKEKGAIVNTKHYGFHARNIQIAKQSEILIAFSWSNERTPTDGGTCHTWSDI